MSGGVSCQCPPDRRLHRIWRVTHRAHNHSAFSGYRLTPSAYSEVRCETCGHSWRTRALYVCTLPGYCVKTGARMSVKLRTEFHLTCLDCLRNLVITPFAPVDNMAAAIESAAVHIGKVIGEGYDIEQPYDDHEVEIKQVVICYRERR